MLDKVWYFKVGDKDIRVAWPRDTMSRILATVFGVIFVIDLFAGNMLGAFLMGLFFALHTVKIK